MAASQPDVTHNVRLLPSGETTPVMAEPGKHHTLVVHVEGDEAPQAMTPEAAAAEGGVGLPKLGEKFSVNAVMGSATGSIVFPLPQGRTLTPALGLGYDSNAQNGPFGLGWALSVPYVQRATMRPHLGQSARGVPTYDDDAESDVFVFSDAAEVVKVGASGGPDGYAITRYKARLEGSFARIERWEKGGISHWRVTSAANVISIFGFDAASRVADPDDETRVFRWNLSAQIDPVGNTVVYQYATDTEVEPGRGAGCQSVLVRVLYANRKPLADGFPVASQAAMEALVGGGPEDFLFEVLIDWEIVPGSGDAPHDDPTAWFERPDPFSSGRAGFEIRTRRLCRGVRVLHRLGGGVLLASRTELSYDEDPVASRLIEVKHVGIGDDGSELVVPPRTFAYTKQAIEPKPRPLPAFEGLDLSRRFTDAEMVDLDGRAVPGLMVRHLGAFTYHRRIDADTNAPPEAVAFGASASGSPDAHRQRFFDLDLDGRPALVELGPGGSGQVWERNEADDGWRDGVMLPSVPPEADFDEETGFPRVLWGDLDGDGRTDALVVPESGAAPQLWRFEGVERGWEPVDAPGVPPDASGVLSDPDACVLLVDVSGDGLPDLLHLEQGKAVVWPGLGHGSFGEALPLPVPSTTIPTRQGIAGEAVDPRRIRAFDVQGTGGVDLLILGDGEATLWLGECGNAFVAGASVSIPAFEELALSSLCRIEGRGTGSLVLAKTMKDATVAAIDFYPGPAGDVRPMLLEAEHNGIGLQTTITYSPSVTLLPSAEEASPIGRLPYSVPVVTEIETADLPAELYFTSELVYRHGCWDPLEREFRGFGFVEQGDARDMSLLEAKAKTRSGGKVSRRQSLAIEHALPRTFTRSWFHTGIVPPGGAALGQLYATEYNEAYDPSVVSLPEPAAGDPEAARALKGRLLRSESYAEVRPSVELGSDEDAKAKAAEVASRPLSISVHGYDVKTVDSGDAHRCLLTVAEQSLSYSYERKETPDPRVSHNAVLKVDDFGVPLQSIEVAYPRRQAAAEPSLPLGPIDPFDDQTEPEDEEAGARVRLLGAMYEEAKSFVLPGALPGLASARALHQERAGAQVVVVGHTDTEGQTHDNVALSVARARTVGALFHGDVSLWVAQYEGSGVSVWGEREDELMATALGHADFEAFAAGQSSTDPVTLRGALIEAYFTHAGASLPAGVVVQTVGAGEHFLAVPTPDDTAEPANRRVELFLFDTQAEPAVPGAALGPGDGVYDAWCSGMTRTLDVDVQSGEVDDPSGRSTPDAGPEAAPDADLITSEARTDDPQRRTEIVRAEVVTVFDKDEVDHYRVGAVAETRSFAIVGQSGDSAAPFSMTALRGMGGGELLSHGRTYFFDDGVGGAFGGAEQGTPAGIGRTGLVYASHSAVFTQGHFDADFAGDAQAKKLLDASPYVKDAGMYWAPSGWSEHDPDRFFVAVRSFDAFGNQSTVTYDEDVYFAIEASDARSNTVRSEFDPRTLAATRVIDANGSEFHTRFDALGRVTKTWSFGVDDEGTSEADPATRIEYDLEAQPISTTVHARHEHVKWRKHGRFSEPELQHHDHTQISYFSGSAQVLQTRTKIEGTRFRAGGHTVVGNKGQALEAYEPSEGDAKYAVVTGDPVKTVDYDDLGRAIRTEYRDGTIARTQFDAWSQVVFDPNDTAGEVGYEGELDAQEMAALKMHAGTGTHVRSDVLGRGYAAFAELRDDTQHRMVITRTHFDAAGNAIEVIDAEGRVAEKRRFGLGGLQISARSVDGGMGASLPNVDGTVLFARRGPVGSGHGTYTRYDALRRPVSDFVLADGDAEKDAKLLTHRVWVDENPEVAVGEATEPLTYHKGQLLRIYDSGGLQTFVDYDRQGGVERSERVLVSNPKGRPDWTALEGCLSLAGLDAAAAPLLEGQRRFVGSARFDAQGRVVESANERDDGEDNPAEACVRYTYEYTEEGLPKRVMRVTPDGKKEELDVIEAYDVYGRATSQRRGAVQTSFAYDPTTHRLASMDSKAGGKKLQALSYVYDAAGNIVRVRDGAHKKVTTGGEVVEAVTRYRYDSLYRLVEASGREHHGQLSPGRGAADAVVQRVSAANDVTAVRNYTQRYTYDVHGNLLELRHQLAARHSAGAWTRRSQYSAFGNRLRASAVGRTPTPELYPHDERGRMHMPHLDEMEWDEFDQLVRVRRGTTEVYFQYVGGARVRKWTVKGGRCEERVYVGGLEEYRAFVGEDAFDEANLREWTHTEHAPGGLTLDTKLWRDGKAVAQPKAVYRYALGNHLGSTSLEVDQGGKVVSYEEYHPYGTTAYRAVRSGIDVDVNRYRFTGMEKDEETGLAQHGWRYFASWLGRWCSADPIGLGDGVNRYRYCGGNPVGLVDRGGTKGIDATGSPEEIAGQFRDALGCVEPGSDAHADLIGELNGLPKGLRREVTDALAAGSTPEVDHERLEREALSRENAKYSHTASVSPAPENRSFLTRGGGTLVSGGVGAGVGFAMISNPVGWVALAGGLILAGGLALIGVGSAQLAVSYSGNSSARHDDEVTAAALKAQTMSSGPGAVVGAAVGAAVTRSEAGALGGATVGGLLELGLGVAGWLRARSVGTNEVRSSTLASSVHIGGTTRAPARVAPMNPSGGKQNCVACVSATIRNKAARTWRGSADDVEREFGSVDPARQLSRADALAYIEDATGLSASPRPVAFSDAAAPPGHYAVFVGEHVIYGRVGPKGGRYLYDPQDGQVFRTWRSMVQWFERGGIPYLLE